MKYIIIAIYGTVLLLIALVVVRLFIAAIKGTSVTIEPSTHCENCGYDIQQSRKDGRSRCPECGHKIPTEPRTIPVTLKGWLVLCIVVLAVTMMAMFFLIELLKSS